MFSLGSSRMNLALSCPHYPLRPPTIIRDVTPPPVSLTVGQLRGASQFLPHYACELGPLRSTWTRGPLPLNSCHELHSCSSTASHGSVAAPRPQKPSSARTTSALGSTADGFGGKDEHKEEIFGITRAVSDAIALPEGEEEEIIEKEEEKEENVGWSIMKLSLPGLGIVLSDPLMSLIDTACVGQISSFQLAALGPNTLIFNFIFQVFGFMGTTTCNFMANTNAKVATRRERKENQLKASRVLSQALFSAAILGVVSGFLIDVYGVQLLSLLGATPDYMEPALTYLHIRVLSVPAVLILLVGYGACLGRQDARTPLLLNLVAALINLVGDFVFTLWYKCGVAGAAWATVAAQYFAVLLLLRTLRTKPQVSGSVGSPSSLPAALEIGWYGFPTMEVFGEFYHMASSLVARCVLGMVIYTAIGKVAASAGTLTLAAHQVSMQVFWFLSFFPEALSISAQSLIARDVKRNPERARTVARVLLNLSLGFGFLLAGIVASIHTFGTPLLTADVNVGRLVMSVTKQSMVCSVCCAVAVVVEGIAIATGDLAYLSRMQLLNLVLMLCALISAHRAGWGLSGVWWCLALSFGTRVAYHIFHIISHWQTHLLGGGPVKVTAS